jgi:asparagine synthase (glutamine-hydrolysing)
LSSYERDRFGQRPLYYVEREGALHAAPRVDALLRAARLPRRLDPQAVALSLCDALPPVRAPYRGVARVPPGHVLRPADPGPLLEPAPVAAPSGQPLLDALREAVEELRAGAACALSGGLDSGLLLRLMSDGAAGVRAYTLASDFSDPAELRAAHLLAQACQADHVVVHVGEELLPDSVAEAVAACEEPLWNGAAVARLLFFRQLRQAGEFALLSGVGADELLCGNPAAMRAGPARRRAERELSEELLTAAARAELGTFAEAGLDLETLRRGCVEQLLPSSTLVPECRAGAAEGLEVRLPYLHAPFAANALALPAEACVRDHVGKWPLREAACGLLPEDIRSARKAARLAPGGGGSRRARARWLELYDEWLRPERLLPLECVDTMRARALLDHFAGANAPEAQRAAEDAVLLRLTSLAMLALTD